MNKLSLPPRPRKHRVLRMISGSLLPSALAHWLGVRAIAIAPEQIALREGMRAGVAVGAVMIVALKLAMPLMAWSAFAAFWTCLVDPGGLLRTRLMTMLKFASAGTCVTGIMAAASGLGTVPAFIGLGVFAFVCGLARMRGAIATQISVLVAIVAVVAVCYPQSPMGALQLSGLFAAGAIWATLVCVLAWPVDPYAPQRQACSAIFREQGYMTRRLLDFMPSGSAPQAMHQQTISAFRRDIRSRIEMARGKIEVLSAGAFTSRTRAVLLPAIEAADRIFIAVMAFEHAVLSGANPPTARRTVRLVAATLHRVARESLRPEPRPEALDAQIRFLRILGQRETDVFTKGAHQCAQALADLQTAWRNPGQTKNSTSPLQSSTKMAAAPADRTIFVRHAARLSVAVLVAYAISLKLNLSYAYWAMMAVVVVTQPSVSTTLPRTIERVAGSIAGGLLAAVMGVLFPLWAILLMVFPLAAATIALRSVNYTLCVMFMTQLFVLVTDLVSPALGWDVALSRSINNIIGSLVGLAACLLLWPEKRQAPLSEQVAEAFKANIRYAALASSTEPVAWELIDKARREAGTTSTRAEILCQQAKVEGLRRTEYLNTNAAILFQLRKLAGAASVWWMENSSSASTQARSRATFYANLAKTQDQEPLTLQTMQTLLADMDSDAF